MSYSSSAASRASGPSARRYCWIARAGAPAVGFIESGGARLQEGLDALDGYGRIFQEHVRLSGQVPQICLLFGPSAAGGAYIPAFCDVVIMRDGNAVSQVGFSPHGGMTMKRDDFVALAQRDHDRLVNLRRG